MYLGNTTTDMLYRPEKIDFPEKQAGHLVRSLHHAKQICRMHNPARRGADQPRWAPKPREGTLSHPQLGIKTCDGLQQRQRAIGRPPVRDLAPPLFPAAREPTFNNKSAGSTPILELRPADHTSRPPACSRWHCAWHAGRGSGRTRGGAGQAEATVPNASSAWVSKCAPSLLPDAWRPFPPEAWRSAQPHPRPWAPHRLRGPGLILRPCLLQFEPTVQLLSQHEAQTLVQQAHSNDSRHFLQQASGVQVRRHKSFLPASRQERGIAPGLRLRQARRHESFLPASW